MNQQDAVAALANNLFDGLLERDADLNLVPLWRSRTGAWSTRRGSSSSDGASGLRNGKPFDAESVSSASSIPGSSYVEGPPSRRWLTSKSWIPTSCVCTARSVGHSCLRCWPSGRPLQYRRPSSILLIMGELIDTHLRRSPWEQIREGRT